MKKFAAIFGLFLVVACGGSVDPVGERQHGNEMVDAGAFADAGDSPADAGLDAGVDVRPPRTEDQDAAAAVADAGRVDAGLTDARAPISDLSDASPTEQAMEDAGPMPEPEPEPVEEVFDAGPLAEVDASGLQDAGASESHLLQVTVNPLTERFLRVGGQRQLVLDLSLLATTVDLQVRDMAVYFSCTGGSIIGSRGVYYFNHFALEDLDTGEVLFGPKDFALRSPWPLEPPPEPFGGVSIGFPTTIDLSAGQPRRIGYLLDVADVIDAPGELIGLTCQAAMYEGFGVNNSVFNSATEEYLTYEDMNVRQIFSDEMVVSGDAWGEFSFCPVGDVMGSTIEGCCTTGGFARDEPRVLSGMAVKSDDSPAIYYIASDGQRHLFPTRTEFFSWYGWDPNDPTERPTFCRNVREFPVSVISAVPIGQRIRVRPGTYLLKIASDAYVHAVARRGTLKKFWAWYPEGCTGGQGFAIGDPMCGWVGGGPASGDEAHQLFPNAEARVRTISDDCYLSYTVEGAIGEPPIPVGDYDPLVEWGWGSPNPLESDLGLLNP